MAEKMLNRKERKRYSKLLREHLTKMGVADRIVMVPTGIRKKFVIPNKPEKEWPVVEMRVAKNTQRALIRKFRQMPKASVDAFLKLNTTAFTAPETETK